MDGYIQWLNTLPLLLRCLAIFGSVLGGFAVVGAITYFAASGQTGRDPPQLSISLKKLPGLLFMGMFSLIGMGIFVTIILAVLLGPFLLMYCLFGWPHLVALILGLPCGFMWLLGLILLSDHRSKHKNS